MKHNAAKFKGLWMAEIIIGDRLRQDTPEVREKIEESLVPSIKDLGLIHPVLVQEHAELQEGKNYKGEVIKSCLTLVAGWCRLQAFAILGKEVIPATIREDLSAPTALEVELFENTHRTAMTWQEQCLAIERIHYAKAAEVAEYNKGKNKKDRIPAWGQAATGMLLGVALGPVNEALLLAKYIKNGDKEVCAAATVSAARASIAQRAVDKLASKAAKKKAPAQTSVEPEKPKPIQLLPSVSSNETEVVIDLSSRFFNQDSIYAQPDGSPSFFDTLSDESFDLIYTDHPFGIDMDALKSRKNIDRVEDAHDVAENLAQMPVFFKHAYRVLRDKSYLLFWCDLKHWEKITGTDILENGVAKEKPGWLQEAGFSVCPYPLIWHKTHSCKNMANHCWPTKNFEYVCVARKGQATLVDRIQNSVFPCSGTEDRKAQANPFAKPFEFAEHFLPSFARKGAKALDPYAGEGSLVRAMIKLGYDTYSCEKEEKHYNLSLHHIKEYYIKLHGKKVKFV